MSKERRSEKTFEDSVRTAMGTRWNKVSKEDKKVIHEMSMCQKKGGAIGSAPIENDSK